MKRTKTITARGDGISLVIKIKIESIDCLTREECTNLLEKTASEVMLISQRVPYITIPLSRIKVSK